MHFFAAKTLIIFPIVLKELNLIKLLALAGLKKLSLQTVDAVAGKESKNMHNHSIKPNTSTISINEIQQESLLIHLGKKAVLFSTLLKKLTLGWGKTFTRAELIKTINSLMKQGLVTLEARNLDIIVKPIVQTPQRK